MKNFGRLENYIEQALFYARSNTVEKDYYIKKCSLKEVVNESVKKNKNVFYSKKTILKLFRYLEEVLTDISVRCINLM